MKNWYRDYKKGGKYLYHASHNKLSRLMPRSRFFGYVGAYASPSYRSLIIDWAYYVLNKKHKDHPLEKTDKRVRDEIMMLEDKEDDKTITTEETERLKNLLDRERRIHETMSRKEYQKSTRGYQTLYIHTIWCPAETYKECEELFYAVADKRADPMENFGFWNWGAQIFIPDYLLKDVKIISVKEISAGELMDELFDEYKRKPMYPSKMYGDKKTDGKENKSQEKNN